MGIAEYALLTAGSQFAQACSVYLGQITPPPTNVWAKAAVLVGKQLAKNLAVGMQAGANAALAEFKTTQLQEANVATVLQALPPIV